MGIFRRISELVRANINDLIDTVSDPEKILNQLMLELREEKRKAQVQVVRCIADEKRLEQQVREHQDKLAQWQKRAEVAVLRDEDDLAREAISRRNEYATMVDELTRQWEEQHQTAEQLKDAMDQLEKRYREAEMRKQHLVNQHRAAVANRTASETISKMANTNHLDGFNKVEEKIKQQSALASANHEIQEVRLEDRFSQLESEGVVEHDLIQIKLQMGKTVPQLAGASGAGPAQAALPGSAGNGTEANATNGAAGNGTAGAAGQAASQTVHNPATEEVEEDDPASFK
ncbi:MAG TPA: PspA/IM30 family protein [Armatimonadota bacterium]|nr:PspA/IM30 family protein [Armatimonadota bacterium]